MSAVKVSDLWWKYEASDKWVIEEVSFEVYEGEFLGIMGPSGAGKTTLSLILMGIIPKYIRGKMKGFVKVFEKDVSELSMPELSKYMGIVFQDPDTQFVTMRVLDEVLFPMENFRMERREMIKRAEEALKATGTWTLRERYPFELSGGQKQRVAIASMIARRPKILILDETTSDLDSWGKKEVYKVLDKLRDDYGITIIMVDHDAKALARYADNLLIMNNGRILSYGSPNYVFNFLRQTDDLRIYVENSVKRKSNNESHTKVSNVEKAVVIDNVTYTYPNGVKALDNVSLSIDSGEFIAIIGQNGAGKTTLAKVITGLFKPEKGSVIIFGEDIKDKPVSQIALRVGYIYQNPDHQLFCNTVFEECSFALNNMGLKDNEVKDRVRRALNFVGLEGKEDMPPFFLSKGERQRLAIAVVLAMNPDIIIVDEPTTGQDMIQSRKIMDALRKLNMTGKTIIIITHNLDLVKEYADKTFVMNDMRIVARGYTDEVVNEARLLKTLGLLL